MDAIAVDAMVPELVRLARVSGRSRFPVYGADLDDIRGVVHVKAVQQVPLEERSEARVADLMNDAVFVPDSRDLDDLLVDIQRSRSHLVVVVDEYGGTA